jgi:hypothetical protein
MDRNAVKAFFQAQGKHVLTFVGYSAAGYGDPARLRVTVEKILEEFDPAHTLVNGGATSEGIGVVYALARDKGFTTTFSPFAIENLRKRNYQKVLPGSSEPVFSPLKAGCFPLFRRPACPPPPGVASS